MGLVASGVWLAFTLWSQERSDRAHDLYQVGEFAGAYDAEVYYRDCRGCESQFRATIAFSDHERTMKLPSVDWDKGAVETDRWVTAPPPYDGTFVVYYDPDAPHAGNRIMTVEDVEAWVYGNDVTTYWIVFGAIVVFTLIWVRPTLRAHVEAEQKIRAVRTAFGDRDEAAITDGAGQRVDQAIFEALDQIETRTRERIRRHRLEDLVLAGGLVLTGVGVSLCATDARTAAVAMHLQASGATTTASDALITIGNWYDETISHEVYAEIDVDTPNGDPKQVPVKLLVPTRELDEPLEPGWYSNIAPYDFDFDVRYDTDHHDWVVAEADLADLARPGDIVVPVLLVLAGIGTCVGTGVRLVRCRERPDESRTSG